MACCTSGVSTTRPSGPRGAGGPLQFFKYNLFPYDQPFFSFFFRINVNASGCISLNTGEQCARPVMRCIVSRGVGARRTRIRAAGSFRRSGIRVGQSGQMSRLQLGHFRRVHHSSVGPQWGWSRVPAIRPRIPLRRGMGHVQNENGSENLKAKLDTGQSHVDVENNGSKR